jgi:tetratricopeptide (TPR) repeat protein
MIRLSALLLFCLSLPLVAQPTGELPIQTASLSAKENFQLAVREFNNGNLPVAEKHLVEVVKLKPNHAEAHYNLGLVYYQTSRLGLALAHWRTAIDISPSLKEARRALEEFGKAEINFQSHFLLRAKTMPLEGWILLLLVSTFVFAWKYIEKVGAKKKYLRGGSPPTSLPWYALASLVISFVFAGVLILLAWDLSLQKATVIASKVELRSGPTAESSSLIDLKEGLEVHVRDSQSDWLQIEEPRGLTGWLLKDQIMVTSRRWR